MSEQVMVHDEPVHIDHRARMEILVAVLLTMFLSALDQTIVGTALPRIVTELNGNELYVWVVTIYLLTATVSGPIYGKLSDLFGRRPMMMIGVSLFLLGSLLCALSQEMWQLIVFRGVQGLGAGAIFPIALAIIGDLFSPRERGKYQGLFGAVFALASIIGPALGGFLTDTISWHWVFLVNLPLGLVALFVLWRLLPQVRHPEAVKSIDYLGAGVFIAAIVPLLIGLTNAQFGEWSDPQVGGLIALGLVLGAVFVWVESRAGRADHPARAVPQSGRGRVDRRHLPHHVRLLRGHHLHPAMVPVRARLERDAVGLPDAAAHGGRPGQLRRCRGRWSRAPDATSG